MNKKVRVQILCDEAYPVYSVKVLEHGEHYLTAEQVKTVEKAHALYREAQEILHKAFRRPHINLVSEVASKVNE